MIFCLSLFLSLNRLVHSGPGKGSPQAGVDLSFATRTGTRQGIETHLFRAETSRDLSHWTRSIVQGCHNSAELVTEVTTGEHPGLPASMWFPVLAFRAIWNPRSELKFFQIRALYALLKCKPFPISIPEKLVIRGVRCRFPDCDPRVACCSYELRGTNQQVLVTNIETDPG